MAIVIVIIPDIWPIIKPQHTCLSLEDALTFGFSKLLLTQYTGGTVRLADSTTFKISTEIAAAELFIEPWALRAFHWHPNQDEWQFYLGGSARVTLFAADGNAQTFDFEVMLVLSPQIGDITWKISGILPCTYLRYLEIFNTARLSGWRISDEVIATFNKTNDLIVGGFNTPV
ncbi:hypothetical protein C8Q75DRAFT_810027 [Abortiporus biennis]|nr:hypothetical protein C8Q75DRAFT_810027 [Abortiporus biennis]